MDRQELFAARAALTPADRAALGALIKASVRAFAEKAPGHTVELRVPPFIAVQCVEGLIDATGRQLVNTYLPYGQQPPMTGDMETVRRILETKAPVVSNLFTSLAVKKPVFNVSIPICRATKFVT